jgi:hypothetical protein
MERSSLSGLRSYLATAASCAAIALSVGYVAESANSFAYKDPINHSRALFYTAVWVAKDAASFSLKRRKLRGTSNNPFLWGVIRIRPVIWVVIWVSFQKRGC